MNDWRYLQCSVKARVRTLARTRRNRRSGITTSDKLIEQLASTPELSCSSGAVVVVVVVATATTAAVAPTLLLTID